MSLDSIHCPPPFWRESIAKLGSLDSFPYFLQTAHAYTGEGEASTAKYHKNFR